MRHRFHAICPYFAMFPERFVQKNLVWSDMDDLVFDPFSGRGTTVFESLLNRRRAIGCDTNPVAVCVSNAKAAPPTWKAVLHRLDELESTISAQHEPLENRDFFRLCFHPHTIEQVLHLRANLRWRERADDCFIAALILGSLHGESHRSERYFSNRMPRTISTNPHYSVEWWQSRGYVAPKRDAFSILRTMAEYRFSSEPPPMQGEVKEGDARKSSELFDKYRGQVSLVITSPPYLDTTDFVEDQWLRLWFLGGPPTPRRLGPTDDRHTSIGLYWQFLTEVWTGVAPLLKKNAHLIIRIGGKMRSVDIASGLSGTLRKGLGAKIRLHEERVTPIKDGQIKTFQPGLAGTRMEYDFHYQNA
jgi:hypothetical protein